MAKKLKNEQHELDGVIEELEEIENGVLLTGVDAEEVKPNQAVKSHLRKKLPAWMRIERMREERELKTLFDPFDGL